MTTRKYPFLASDLERDFIVRGEVGAFGRCIYFPNRVVADFVEIGGRDFLGVVFPKELEASLRSGAVRAVVMTKVGDGATVMAVLESNAAVHVHPELPRMNDGVSFLARIAFGGEFQKKLEGIKHAVAYLAQKEIVS